MLVNRLFSGSHNTLYPCNPFRNNKILDSSKLKESAHQNFKSDGNGTKFSQWLENTVTSNFSFSHSVFKRLVQRTHKNQGLGKG